MPGLSGEVGDSPQATRESSTRAATNPLLGGSHGFSFGFATADQSGQRGRAVANVSAESPHVFTAGRLWYSVGSPTKSDSAENVLAGPVWQICGQGASTTVLAFASDQARGRSGTVR